MAVEEPTPEGMERGARVGVPGGSRSLRPQEVLGTPLTPEEISKFETRIGKLPAALPPRKPQAALVAEDDVDMRRLLIGVLQKMGFEVYEASTGVDALKIFFQVTPSVLVVDIRMPGMDGFEVIRGVRGFLNDQDMRIFVVTGLSDPKDEVAALNIGADAFLRKPYSMAQITAHLGALIRRLPKAQ